MLAFFENGDAFDELNDRIFDKSKFDFSIFSKSLFVDDIDGKGTYGLRFKIIGRAEIDGDALDDFSDEMGASGAYLERSSKAELTLEFIADDFTLCDGANKKLRGDRFNPKYISSIKGSVGLSINGDKPANPDEFENIHLVLTLRNF